MQRLSLLLAAAALPACAVDLDTSTTNQAATLTKYESRRCDVNLCILHWERDSDHDGISDADELAAGTDPNDPTKYPAIGDLLGLVSQHALPSFEIGNSLFVLLPTIDANGLPVFGGSSLLPARKSSLEQAGIKVPGSIDISHGFTMSRAAKSHDMTFGSLLTAFGREDPIMPVKLLATAVGHMDHTQPFVAGHSGAQGVVSSDHSTGTVQSEGGTSEWTTSQPNGVHASGTATTGKDGSYATDYTMFSPRKDGDTDKTHVTIETSADGAHSVTVTTHIILVTDSEGKTTEVPLTTTIETCDNGTCETTTVNEDESDEGDYPSTPADDGTSVAYIDPIAAEAGGIVGGVTSGAMHIAITASKTTLTVEDWNDPLSSYTVPPTGIYNPYGRIALYGGDPENNYAGSSGVPSFVHVPSPQTDTGHSDRMPTTDVPLDQTCLYCR